MKRPSADRGPFCYPRVPWLNRIMLSPATPIEKVQKISKRIVPQLRHLGIKTIRDLLFYFPARYEDFSRAVPITEADVGNTVTVQGTIKHVSAHRTARKKINLTEVVVEDTTGKIKALWFNQPFLARSFHAGQAVRLSGKVALGPQGPYLQNPAHERIARSTAAPNAHRGIHTGGLVPIYPETRGITSRWLRYLISTFLPLRKTLPDPLPDYIRKKYALPALSDALQNIHFPKNKEEAERAEGRFSFEELLLIQLRALRERQELKKQKSPAIPADIELIKKCVATLPFPLTAAQRRSAWEIVQDMEKSSPMNRLLNGDVGSGKTIVAAIASLVAAAAGFKAIFMAPTEILARQHFETIQKILAPFAVRVGLMTGSEKKADEDMRIIIGTHALIQKGVRFRNVGLVVVDEQHRFGVEQRAALLRDRALIPHFLSMTATPIPRTLALTVYGDLDLSMLDEMPKNRKRIITKIVEPNERESTYQFIREEIGKGRQAFVICPRIESQTRIDTSMHSDIIGAAADRRGTSFMAADTRAVKQEFEKLSQKVFPNFRIGMLHGKMKAKEKNAVMKKFQNRGFDIMVSTSVVEVGVDIPNATMMIIEGAERFGLAQLHQFRGRVGRGEEQSYCFLFPSDDAHISQRLRAIVEAKNGFELAERDLTLRGPGDIFGTRQWGISVTTLKSVAHPALVRIVRNEAIALFKNDPALRLYPTLRDRLDTILHIWHKE